MRVDRHHHLVGLAVDIEAVGAGGAWRVEQGVDHKARGVLVRGFEPELREIGEFLAFFRVGINRQATRREAVLAGGIHRTEVAGAQKRQHVMAVQLRRLEQLEPGETQVAGQLLGVHRGFFIVEQRRAKMHFAGFTGLGVDAVHAHRRLETHADVEELHVQLAVQLLPQRMVTVIADGVEILRGHGGQGRRQHLLSVLVATGGQLLGLGLERFEIERHGLAIGSPIPGPGLRGQQATGRQTGVSRNGHGCFEQIPAVHRDNLS